MQDAYYGLVFSYAVDAFQDAVGFDADYRQKQAARSISRRAQIFLREVKEGDY